MSGPKISIGIDDSVTQKVEQLNAQLRLAKKEVRELEKQADKALKQTGKLSDELIKKIDDAKKRAGGLNSQLRGMRSPVAPGRGGKGDSTAGTALDNLQDLMQDARVFGSGLRGGGGFLNALRGVGGASNRAFMMRAGLTAAGVLAVGKGGLATYDRDFAGEKTDEDIRIAKMFGQDTELQEMERRRAKLTGGGIFKFAGAVADIVPGGSRFSAFAGEAYASARGLGKADFASAVFNKSTEGMSAERKGRLYESAKQEVDGNPIETTFRDAANALIPDGALKNWLNSEREEKITATTNANLSREEQMKAKGYKLVDTNNFSGAQEAFNLAGAAGKNKAVDAVEAWKQGEASMQAKARYEQSQRKVPAYRMGM